MKNLILKTTRLTTTNHLLIIKVTFLFMLVSLTSSFAQNITTATWVGGTPGGERNWQDYRNWDNQKVPTWTTTVIIPDVQSKSGFFPTIETTVAEIEHLKIESDATLLILKGGSLTNNGESTYKDGLLNFGRLHIDGILKIMNTAMTAINNEKGLIQNIGKIELHEVNQTIATRKKYFINEGSLVIDAGLISQK